MNDFEKALDLVLTEGLAKIDSLTDEQLNEAFKCPTCDGYIPNNENIGAYSGALSRRGDYEVCSACGTREALEDFIASKIGVSADSDFFKSHIEVL